MPRGLLSSSTKAVVFDAVGTLIFPSPGAPVVYAAHAADHDVTLRATDVRCRMIAAYAREEAIDRDAGWVTSEDREVTRWRRIVAASLPELSDPEACFRTLFEHFARPDAWEVNRDADQVFARLAARGIPVGLASNYDSRLLRVVAGKPELAPVAGRVVISSLVGRRKPSGVFFQEVVRTFAVEPGQVVFVGDDYGNDYTGATEAGLRAVLLNERGGFPSAVSITKLIELLD
jgi:putative hydrolase of the HAD superfamily